jgi:acyl transferase domain-containing protein
MQRSIQLPTDNPVAIIGMGCRFPGASDVAEFWNLLCSGKDMVREVPPERWRVDGVYDENPNTKGKINSRWGGFIDNVDQFDPLFFKISPIEAERMDPQQRLLLEVAWEAIENAGWGNDGILGSRTGVFVGLAQTEYAWFQFSDPQNIDKYSIIGSAHGIGANRISYAFDFKGPSFTIDTICSSSLLSVHLACQSLRNNECDLALAGGINLLLTPFSSMGLTKMNLLANDGRCRVFDADAKGIVRGEGCGMVLLKPLARAIEDNDRVYAVILGGAVNQDGRSNGITAPNVNAQEAVLRECYSRAGISGSELQYIEAHGTGTILGDPIEARALGSVISEDREKNRPCYVGSVKSNFGHLEPASGVAGIIKVALSIYHKKIPPSIHFNKANPYIPFEELNLRVPATLMNWPYSDPLLAGVSSFAFGGTNVHIVLKEAQGDFNQQKADTVSPPESLFTASGHTQQALNQQLEKYATYLSGKKDTPPLYDFCAATCLRRRHHKYRFGCAGSNTDDICASIQNYLARQHDAKPTKWQRIVFLIPDYSASIANLDDHPINPLPGFRKAAEDIKAQVGAALKTAQMTANHPEWECKISYLVNCLSICQVIQSWGVEPDYLVGIGDGEVVASIENGSVSLQEGLSQFLAKGNDKQGSFFSEQLSQMPGHDLEKQEIPTFGLHDPECATTHRNNDDGLYPRISIPQLKELIEDTSSSLFFSVLPSPTDDIVFSKISDKNPSSVRLWRFQPDKPLIKSMLEFASDAYMKGYPIDFQSIVQPPAFFVDLPPYPWQHESYWIKNNGMKVRCDALLQNMRQPQDLPENKDHRYPLAGIRIETALTDHYIYESRIGLSSFPYLADHAVFGSPFVPSSFFIEIVREVATLELGINEYRNISLSIDRGIFLPVDGKNRIVQTILCKENPDRISYVVSSQALMSNGATRWIRHAHGELSKADEKAEEKKVDEIRARCQKLLDVNELYQDFERRKMHWGPLFQGIEALWQGDSEALGYIRMPEGLTDQLEFYETHPAFLDAAFQVIAATIPREARELITDAYVLSHIDRYHVSAPVPNTIVCHARLTGTEGEDLIRGKVSILNSDGRLIAEADGMNFMRIKLEKNKEGKEAGADSARALCSSAGNNSVNSQNNLFAGKDKHTLNKMVGEYLIKEIVNILEHDTNTLDLNMSVEELGIDSLSAIDLVDRVENYIGIIVPLDIIMQGGSLHEIVDAIVMQLHQNIVDPEIKTAV